MKNFLAILFIGILISTTSAQRIPVGKVFPTRETPVHDPVMIKQDSVYYIFCTGWGISVWSSTNLEEWKREKPVFSKPPQWAIEAVSGFRGHIWAPDISYANGQYYLYYSISRFGKNTSCIGLATNKTLYPGDPDFQWIDHGKIIQSIPGETNWNAIDPNLITDKNGTSYMAFGSFWGGLKLVKLTPDRMQIAEQIEDLSTIATRKKDPSIKGNPPAIDDNPVEAGGNAIEAPFIFKKGDGYYLFASIDYCCKGVNSTYKMIVGRSDCVTGPYLDKDGTPLNRGGGTILLTGDENWYGVGHNAVVSLDGTDYLVFHGYAASAEGKSRLRIEKLNWINGWPVVAIDTE
jgi:arabinan endo-1,5-alpha-L-arabinosidase